MTYTLTAADIVDVGIPGEVTLSPSAEQVIYSAASSGRKGNHSISALWIAKVNQEDSAKQFTSGLYNDRMPQWSSDGDSIAFISDREKQGETCAIYIMSIDGEEAVSLTSKDSKQGIEIFKWSPDGTHIAYISSDEKTSKQLAKLDSKDDANVYGEDWNYNRLRVVDVSTRTTLTLYSEDAHTCNLAWSPDSKRIAFTTQHTPEVNSPWYNDTQFNIVSIKGSTNLKQLCHFPGSIESSLEWLGENLYFGAKYRPSSLISASALYKLGSKEGNWQMCYLGESNDFQGMRTSTTLLSVKVVTALQNEIHLIDGTILYSDQEEILGLNFDKNFDVARDSAGNYVIALGKSSASKPTEIYTAVYIGKQLNAQNLIKMSGHGKKIADLDIGTAESLSCKSYDGKFILDAIFVSPTLHSESTLAHEPLPTAVLIHGGPYDHKTDSFNSPYHSCPWAPMILSKGNYGVLIPNYRGNSSYGEEFASQAENKSGTYEYDDILALVDKGITSGLINKEKIIIGGWSQGGMLSYLAAVRNGYTYEGKLKDWTFKGVIAGAGVVDFDSYIITSDAPYFGGVMAGGSPWEKEKDNVESRKGSALWEFAGSKVPPILILHGEADKRVPINQAWGFHRACLSANVACELVTYPREPHLFVERAHLIDMLQRVLHFCDMHLG